MIDWHKEKWRWELLSKSLASHLIDWHKKQEIGATKYISSVIDSLISTKKRDGATK